VHHITYAAVFPPRHAFFSTLLSSPFRTIAYQRRFQVMNRTADAFDCLSLAVMTYPVSKFLGKMTATSSPGFKEFSAPFLKCAYPGNEKDENVIVPYLANLFHIALSKKRIPACWKKPRSTPFTKKALSLTPTTTACWLWLGLCIDCTPTSWKNWWPCGVLRAEKFLTSNLASTQTVAQSSLCLF